MRKSLMILFVLLLFGFDQVDATVFSTHLPGGKNYLDAANVSVVNDVMRSIDLIRVKPFTTYTFSIADDNIFGFPYLYVEGDGDDYFDGNMLSSPDCGKEGYTLYCTFSTNEYEFIRFRFEAFGLSQYFDYYGMDGIQLEEGSAFTQYEEYVIPYIDVTSPEFEGSGAFVKAYYEEYAIQDIIDDYIIVYDDIDGDLTNSIVIVEDDYTENMYTVGNYFVLLEATDLSGNTSSFELLIMVKDELLPTINGPSQIVLNVDDELSLAEIITGNYSASDDHDGAIEITVVTDNYSGFESILGVYSVELYTVDSSGNTVTKLIELRIVDNTAPILESSSDISIMVSNPKSLAAILGELLISDNYDAVEDIELTVMYEQYTGHETMPGTYEIEIGLTDLSNNTQTIVLFVTIVDNVAPIITGPTTLETSYTTPYTLFDIFELLEVSDNVDLLSTSDLIKTVDTYTTRTTQIGTYDITFTVSDSANNIVTHTITITLIDDQAPKIYLDNYLITITPQASFSPADALNMMIKNEVIPEGDYTITTVVDEYTGNERKPGEYKYTLQFVDETGKSIEKEFVINVTDTLESTIEPAPLIRNIIVYSVLLVFIGYIIYNTKK